MAGGATFINEQQKKAARERGDLIRQQLGKLKRKGVTLTKVAKRAGVSRTYLYKLINAKIITPAISTLSKIEKVLGWGVPAHRFSCPSGGTILDTSTVGSFLKSLLRAPARELEHVANTFFYRGNLPVNIAARLILSQKRLKDGNREEAVIELVKATISNAGTRLSEVIGPTLWPKPLLFILNSRIYAYQKFRYLLALGNRARNIGDPNYAEKQCYGLARSLQLEKAEKPWHALERRELSVSQRCASLNEAERLIKDAENDAEQYGVRTTRSYIAWDNFRKKEYLKAHDQFDTILHDNSLGAIVSWWHKMAGCLGLGVTMYTNDRIKYDEALGYCLQAEYISAMLGLQVDVTRGICEQLLGHHILLSPSAVVRKIGREIGVSKEKMEKIRHKALIESGLQKELLAELRGDSWALDLFPN